MIIAQEEAKEWSYKKVFIFFKIKWTLVEYKNIIHIHIYLRATIKNIFKCDKEITMLKH